ncbi:MAG: PorT family protein [Hymenobacter sp.]|nr:MAG: PorT family protein [Hymenobacter sp.]
MKKTLLALVFAVGALNAAQAQSARFGIKAGASLTSLTNTSSQTEYKFGFNGGVLANFAVNDMFSIQPEVLYSNKGYKFKNLDDTRFALNYIDVPVLAKIATGATGLFFEVGPQVGFRLSADLKDSNNSASLKDFTKSVDFGYAAGLGFQVESGAMIGLRYNGGISKVGKDVNFGNGIVATAADSRNSAFQLYVGYLLGGK